MRRAYLLAIVSFLAACGGSGGGDQACNPGEAVTCECAGGFVGSAPCWEDGTPGRCACPGAVEWAPSIIDFGVVQPNSIREATLVLWTVGETPIAVTGATIEGDSDFRVVDRPNELPAGGVGVPIVVAYLTHAPVEAQAVLVVKTDVGDVSVPLRAAVYGPLVTCTEELRWSDVPVGGWSSQQVFCENHGIAGADDPAIARIADWASGDDEFEALLPSDRTISPGETRVFHVVYRPLDLDRDDTMAVLGFDGDQYATVHLVGSAVDPLCDLELSVAPLSGVPGQILDGEIALRNRRTDAACRLARLELDAGCDDGFDFGELPGASLLSASASLAVPFAFAGETVGSHLCTVRVVLENPPGATFNATATVELSWRPCLVASGVTVPSVSPSCGPSRAELVVGNACEGTLLVDEVRVGAGSAAGFSVGSIEPVALDPWEEVRIPVVFDPAEEGGPFHGTIEVISSLDSTPWSFPVAASSGPDDIYSDYLLQQPLVKVDVLVVVDNGVGMGPESTRLIAELGAAPDVLRAAYDYRLAVTTTGAVPADIAGCFGGADGGEDGRLFPVDGSRPRVITRSTPDGRAVWEQNLAVGRCQTAPSRALEMAALAVSPGMAIADDPRHPEENDGNAGFLRDDVPLLVMLISDRDDASPDTPASYFDDLVEAKQGAFVLTNVVTVAGAPDTGCTGADGVAASAGNRLHQFAELAWGTEFSICDPAWGLLGLFDDDLQACFRPRAAPADLNGNGVIDEGDIQVLVGTLPVPPTRIDGSPNWIWIGGRVCFAPDAVPSAGALIEIKRLYCPAG